MFYKIKNTSNTIVKLHKVLSIRLLYKINAATYPLNTMNLMSIMFAPTDSNESL